MKKRTVLVALVLLAAGMIPVSYGLAQERTDLGWITLPRSAEFPTDQGDMAPVPKGDYRLSLFGQGKAANIVLVSGDTGTAFGCPTEVAETKETYAEPKSDVSVVTKDGQDFVQIVVFKGNFKVTSLMKCSD